MSSFCGQIDLKNHLISTINQYPLPGKNNLTIKKHYKLKNIYPTIITHNNTLILNAIQNISYPTKIHCTKFCKCNRILEKKSLLSKSAGFVGVTTFVSETNTTEPNNEIVYVIEKIWNDNEYQNYPNHIFIVDKKIESNDDINNNEIIKIIYQDSIIEREIVFHYFDNYQWSKKESITVRNIVKNMISICFCRENLIIDSTTNNSGFIIVGNKKEMEIISNCFNNYVNKTEISHLYVCKLSNIKNIRKENMGHTIKMFANSNDIKNIDPTLYTLIGEEDNKYKNKNKKIYTFSFGKREWVPNKIETSFICAKRELYEEFNIQVSNSIIQYSQSLNNPQNIRTRENILFFIYLPNNTNINYHIPSDTIYLSLTEDSVL